MRAARPWPTLTAVRLTIEIHDDEDVVMGWLEGDGHPCRPFVGMLELIGLLDAVRGTDRRRAKSMAAPISATSALGLLERDDELERLLRAVTAAELVAAGSAEILLPILLVLGLATRLAAFGLLVMTLIVQLTVPEGWPIHLAWAAMALAIMTWGPGQASLDQIIGWQQPA